MAFDEHLVEATHAYKPSIRTNVHQLDVQVAWAGFIMRF